MVKDCGAIWRHRRLLWQLIGRDVQTRYQGSMLGVAWAFLVPLSMLVVYTVAFSQLFQARWGQGPIQDKLAYALNAFAGLLVFNLFAETFSRSAGSVLSQSNYVKRVIFPLEILPLVPLGSALVQAAISLLLLLLAATLLGGHWYATALVSPLLLVPLILGLCGVSWIAGAIGVYVRDLLQAIGFLVTATMFLTPVFFPLEQVPKAYQWLLHFNPLTLPILQLRQVILEGRWPSGQDLLWSLLINGVLALLGLKFFHRLRRGFADVL